MSYNAAIETAAAFKVFFIIIVAVIIAVVITVIIMRRKIKDAGKAMIYKGHGVRGLYPEGAISDSPPLHRYQAVVNLMDVLQLCLLFVQV